MATEMNTTPTTLGTSVVRRDAPFGKAEVVAGLQASAGAGYFMGTMALAVSWVHDWGIWLPYNDVAQALIPALGDLGTSFNAVAVGVGLTVHYTISLVLGLLFTVLYSRVIKVNPESGLPVLVGFAFGVLTWLMARYGVLPTLGSEIYARPAFLIAHMVFGATLGLLYPLFIHHNHKHHPSWE